MHKTHGCPGVKGTQSVVVAVNDDGDGPELRGLPQLIQFPRTDASDNNSHHFPA